MRKRILAIVLLVSIVAFSQEESYKIEERSVEVVTKVRVHAQAEKSERVNNPIRWQPIEMIVPDGMKVEKGDVVAKFVSAESELDLARLLLRQKVIETSLSRKLASIDNKNLDMDDQMGVLEDKLASLESKLERQKSEPTEDDVRIVEGRLRIARMNLDASRKDYEKAQDRFERKMISRAELDAAEKDLNEKIAKELYARQDLEVTKNPPNRAGNIRTTEIEIEAAKLEIEKLAFEIKEQLTISEIQRKGAIVNKERNAREINEKKEDIEKIVVKAPSSGFVSLNKFDGNDILPGTKMWPNYGFADIPDMGTLQFKGVLLESRRQLHAENDTVHIRVNGRKDEPLTATIKSISTLSHDLAEKEDANVNRDRKFGVKVFDVIMVLDNTPDWVRPGMYGEAELHSHNIMTGPVVPLNFVKQVEGKCYISLDGIYKEVSGTKIGSEFLLEDKSLIGREITTHGKFDVVRDEKGEEEKRLTASSELLPVRSTNVVVPKIGWWPWPKITWLVPEETMVKKGEVVAKLDPQEREKQARSDEEVVIEQRSSRDELEKKVEITRRTCIFKLKNAEFNLEKTRIASEATLDIVSPLPVYSAEMNLKLAEIKLADQDRKVKRELSKEQPTVSPAELRKMKRELERSKLKVEQAQLKLDKAKEGNTAIAKSKARLNLSESMDNLETVKRQNVYDNLAIKREYERSKMRVQWYEKRWEHRKEQVANHTIISPEDGLICYNKVYNNGAITKVAVGNTVGPRFRILSIPDLSEMELNVEVEEKYYSGIKEGMEVEVRLPSLSDRKFTGNVTGIDLLFKNRAKKDGQLGLYSSHEPLGEVTFQVRVRIKAEGVTLKPGLIGEVFFPIQK